MKKKDFILIAIVLATAAVLAIAAGLHKGKTAGETQLYADVRVDGKVQYSYPLNEDRTETIDNEYGTNYFEIKDGQVNMIEANCPDGYCELQQKISDVGDMIVCLPHHLIIEISDHSNTDESPENAPDVVAK